MFTVSKENFDILVKQKEKQIEFGKKFQKRVKRIELEDRVVLYVKDLKKWILTATIDSKIKNIIKSNWIDDTLDYRYKVDLSINSILDENNGIDASYIAPSLEYLKKWLPEHWELGLSDSMHILSARDFNLIESEINKIT
jgi:hypothetical protein